MAGLRFTDNQYDMGGNNGYYQHTRLSEIVSNFMVQETSEGMMLSGVSQTLVEYHAQRGMQELSYDTLRSVKSFAFSPEGSISVPIPQDAVGVVGVSWADDNGYKHPMIERRHSGNPETPLIDSSGDYMYDMEGNRLNAQSSNLVEDYNNRRQNVGSSFYNYYGGAFANDDLYERYYSYEGGRYGAEPSELNANGTYVFDIEEGLIYIQQEFNMREIIVDYVSDGLGDDLTNIRIHKFAEDALYMYIKHKIISSKMNMPLYEKQLAKKEWGAARRNAKHRLSGISPEKIYNVLLNKTKWIKR